MQKFLFFLLLASLQVQALPPKAMAPAKIQTLKWQMLLGMNSKTGKATPEVLKLHKQKVRIPGFIVPLEYSFKDINEFLFVPVVPGCMHVPAPPPEQTIYVKMKKKMPMMWETVWVTGDLKVVEAKKENFGEASYEMDGESIEIFKEKDLASFGLRGLDDSDMIPNLDNTKKKKEKKNGKDSNSGDFIP